MNALEWYLGLPARPEGEDLGWRLELFHLPPAGWASGVVAAVLVSLAVVSIVVYVRQILSLPARLRSGLVVLRCTTVLLVCLLLLGLGVSAQRFGRPYLLLMLDTSASMTVRDVELESSGSGESRPVTSRQRARFSAMRDQLLSDEAALLQSLMQRYRVRVYRFGRGAEAWPPIDTPNDLSELMERLDNLTDFDSETRPATAMRQILPDFRGRSVAAVVALTDGVSSTGTEDRWSNVAGELTGAGIPFVSVAVGAMVPPTDIQLLEAVLPELVWVGQPVSVLAEVRCRGANRAQVRLELRRNGDPQLLGSASLQVSSDDMREWVSLPFTPHEAGELELEISAIPIAGEWNLENNRLVRSLEVRQGRIRVLLVEHAPRWEYRHLKAILERDPLVELNTFLLSADPEHAQEDATALSAFPATRETLLGPFAIPEGMPDDPVSDERMGYDVIIWGDVDPEYLIPGSLALVQDFVRLRGGGLIFIAGMDHNPWDYLASPLAPLLPFSAETFEVERRPPSVVPFRLQRTTEGRAFGFLRLDDEPAQNDRVWNQLPRQQWLLPLERLKLGTQVLAVHPTLRGTVGPLPVIVYQRYGAGQVIYLTTDEFWQWRRGVEDRYLGRFWSQMLRAMTPPERRSGAGEGVRLVSRQPVYAEGERMEFRAEFSPGGPAPSEGRGEVVIERDAVEVARVEMSTSPLSPLILTGESTAPPAGAYRAWLAAPILPGAPPSCRFQVDPAHRELLETAVDRRELEQLATQTGGLSLELHELARLPAVLPRGRPIPTSEMSRIPLWSRPEPLLLLTLLLGLEWFLRRRHRLV